MAIDFNGTNEYLQADLVPSIPTGDITISFHSEEPPDYDCPMEICDISAADDFFLFYTQGGSSRLWQAAPGQVTASVLQSVVSGEYQHIAGQFDRGGTRHRIFVDGDSSGSGWEDTYSSNPTAATQDTVTIGKAEKQAGFFSGSIGDVAAWSDLLAPAEIWWLRHHNPLELVDRRNSLLFYYSLRGLTNPEDVGKPLNVGAGSPSIDAQIPGVPVYFPEPEDWTSAVLQNAQAGGGGGGLAAGTISLLGVGK